MDPRRVLPVFALAAFLVSAGVQDKDAEFADKVRAWVAKLKDPVSVVRKKAEEDLSLMGPRAIPILREEESKLPAGELKQKLGLIIQRIERLQRKFVAAGNSLLLSLSAKDKPVAELLAELQKITSVPIEHDGIPSDAVASLEASHLSLWAAVDQVCKSVGTLAWDVSEKGIVVRAEAYSKPFMATTSGYALIFRGFDRVPPMKGSGDRESISSRAYVAGPPGAQSIAEYLTYEVLTDDKGTNLMKTPKGLVFKTSAGGFKLLGEPNYTQPLYESVNDLLDPNPGRGAVKVKFCKGVAIVRAVLDLSKSVEIRGTAIKNGAKASGPGVALEITSYTPSGSELEMEIVVTDKRIGGKKEKHIFYPETGGKVILRDAAGRDLGAELDRSTGKSTFSGNSGEVTEETSNFKVKATLKEGSPLASIEVWEPGAVEEIRIPFDFKDVPILKTK
jgi:hypothetical protein